ncbi:MAG: GWxTD domain-containing protein [Bacteroidales bacterium]|nr:GWxTD domain-containing protein [Bacteroidales bacterium]
MKRHIFFLVLSVLALSATAQRQLSALFNYNAYYHVEQQRPYIETYLSFDAWNLNFRPTADGKYRATVEIILTARQNDSIVYAKKYDLNSPLIDDSNAVDFNFIDLQRFFLDNGIYTLDLTVRDKNSDNAPTQVQQKVSIFYDRKKPSLCPPQLMANVKRTVTDNVLSRAGYDMEPYLSDFIPEQMSQLNIYYEIYNINREVGKDPFLTYIYIEDRATGQRATGIQHMARHKSSAYVPVFATLDISTLPSGNYNLVVEVHDRQNNNLIYQRLPIYRSNPSINILDSLSPAVGTFAADITDETLLAYYLDALYPIASEAEKDAVKSIISHPGLEEKQAFLLRFWTVRDPLHAADRWNEYRGWLEYVDKHFSYPRMRGYKTDRGRVYLQYGPPDFIRDEKNFVSALRLGSGTNVGAITDQYGNTVGSSQIGPDTPGNKSLGHIHYLPYQLWRYNKLERDDANRVFLFWDEFRSGFYKLLVSNARGEVMDPLWERRLSQQQLDEYVVGEVGEQFNKGH